MNKRKETFLDKHRGDEDSAFMKKLKEYYAMKDIEYSKNFLKIFSMLYCSKEKLSYDKIAVRCNISRNTLDGYIKVFNTLAEKMEKSTRAI